MKSVTVKPKPVLEGRLRRQELTTSPATFVVRSPMVRFLTLPCMTLDYNLRCIFSHFSTHHPSRFEKLFRRNPYK
jgi:hypothetical protein